MESKGKCLVCLEELNIAHRKFCSRVCYAEYVQSQESAKFIAGKMVTVFTAKKHLLKQKEYKCEHCALSEWNGKKIVLEIDHIDGNRTNNSLSNLRLLCPNCHSQTETFRYKNVKKKSAPVSPLSYTQ